MDQGSTDITRENMMSKVHQVNVSLSMDKSHPQTKKKKDPESVVVIRPRMSYGITVGPLRVFRRLVLGDRHCVLCSGVTTTRLSRIPSGRLSFRFRSRTSVIVRSYSMIVDLTKDT